VIEAEKASYEVTRMVGLLGVSRSGYYAWLDRREAGPGPRAARRAELTVAIRVAHEASEVVSRKTVAKLMRANNIRGISPRPWQPVTTIGSDQPNTLPDLVGRRFDRGVLNNVWTSDITYLATGEGWVYLCAVRDGCSRRVLGYAFADTLHTDLVETALRRAVLFRDPAAGPTAGVIFHADRGCQYTSTQLAEVAEELGVRLSVGRTGVCWDNAQQESFWSTLKTEFYQRRNFPTRTAAIRAVSTWIDEVYNRRRRHSSLGQIPPITFEQQLTTAATQAA
jgi:putative transposase